MERTLARQNRDQIRAGVTGREHVPGYAVSCGCSFTYLKRAYQSLSPFTERLVLVPECTKTHNTQEAGA